MTHDHDILPPRYQNPHRVGFGGMGEIFKAEDAELERTVAIKLLAERYARDDSVRARFTREALAAARLSAEPCAIKIFDVGEWRDRPFIVMEYLDGGSLEDRLREGKPPPDQALDWLEQAATALDAAHRHGVVHRDIKPGNLLLDGEGGLRVADFGIASAAGMDSLTMTGTVLGTAGYLSPEQARGERATPASDRYALAVVAYELLTGRRPFESDSVTAEAAAHVHAEVPSVSEQIDPIFRRALAKEPPERFESSAEFVDALRGALDPGALPTRELTPTRRSRIPLVVSFVAAAAIAGAGVAAIIVDRSDTTAGAAGTGSERQTVAQPPPPQPPPPPPKPPPPPPPPPAVNGVALTDQATQLLQEGDYAGAERVARQAVGALQGSGETYEAYAEYDLGLALAQLRQCDEALAHLDRSRDLQGDRKEIAQARKICKKRGRDKD